MAADLDLDAYFTRIGFAGQPRADRATLEALHVAHRARIPFENLDVQMGLPIRLDVESLQDKLIARRRGGYCFEQNTLFLAVLRQLGFDARALLGRVLWNATRITPRTHMVLKVELPGGPMLADVGFGALGILTPIPWRDGNEEQQGFEACRLTRTADAWTLALTEGGAWKDAYVFTEEVQHPVDFEVSNHYTSTHPESRFVTTLTAQIATHSERTVLQGTSLWVFRSGQKIEQSVPRAELHAVLRDRFGLEIPAGATFRSLPA